MLCEAWAVRCAPSYAPAACDGHTAPFTGTGYQKAAHALYWTGPWRQGRGLDGACNSRAGHLEAIRRISCGRLACRAQQPAKAPGSHPERQVRLAATIRQAACLVLWQQHGHPRTALKHARQSGCGRHTQVNQMLLSSIAALCRPCACWRSLWTWSLKMWSFRTAQTARSVGRSFNLHTPKVVITSHTCMCVASTKPDAHPAAGPLLVHRRKDYQHRAGPPGPEAVAAGAAGDWLCSLPLLDDASEAPA